MNSCLNLGAEGVIKDIFLTLYLRNKERFNPLVNFLCIS